MPRSSSYGSPRAPSPPQSPPTPTAPEEEQEQDEQPPPSPQSPPTPTAQGEEEEENRIPSNQQQIEPPSSPGDPSSGGESEEEADDFKSVLDYFSKQWLQIHLTHNVSLAASNAFWKLSFNSIAYIFDLKAAEGIRKKIPQFLQFRKNIYKDLSPEVKMTFVFLNKNDGSIIKVQENHTPLKMIQRDPQYKKLYEEAHIEVKSNIITSRPAISKF